MRTTINLDNAVLRYVRQYARARALTLGKAIAELVRKAADAEPRLKLVNGLYIPDLKGSTDRVTTAHVKKLIAEEDDRIPS